MFVGVWVGVGVFVGVWVGVGVFVGVWVGVGYKDVHKKVLNTIQPSDKDTNLIPTSGILLNKEGSGVITTGGPTTVFIVATKVH